MIYGWRNPDRTFRRDSRWYARLCWDSSAASTLFSYLEEGDTLDEFLDDFPSLSREHAVKVLERMKESFLAQDYESAA